MEHEKTALVQPPIDFWCRTKDPVAAKYRAAWTIEKFSERVDESDFESLFSSTFTVPLSDNTRTHWRLRLKPKGVFYGDSFFMSVFLQNETETEIRCKYQFSILDVNKTITNSYSSCSFVTFGERFSPRNEDGYEKFLCLDSSRLASLKEQSSQLLSNDSLTIVCDLTILGNSKNADTLFNHLEEDDKIENLSHDLEKLFSDKELSDVQIICGDKVFDCHQLILSARSPIFRIMFQSEMAEKKTRKVEVKDVDPEVMSKLLTFIYSGKLPKIDKLLGDMFDTYQGLLMASDKYQLDQLKRICVITLCSNMNVENCLSYLVIGDMYQASDLKKSCLQFISSNMAEVFKTKDWEDILKNHPDLMAEVIKEIAGVGGHES